MRGVISPLVFDRKWREGRMPLRRPACQAPLVVNVEEVSRHGRALQGGRRKSAPRGASEPELRRELHNTRIERCGDRSEAGRSELRGWRAEIRGVQQIEYFQAQLDRPLTGKADATHHREVDIA